jgi:hypothetical protein
MGVVSDIDAQVDFGGLAGEGFYPGFVDVNLQVRQVGENIFEHPDPVDYFHFDIHRIGLAGRFHFQRVPTDGDQPFSGDLFDIGAPLAVDDNAATAHGHTADDRLTRQGVATPGDVVQQPFYPKDGGRGVDGAGLEGAGAGDDIGQKLGIF